MPSKWLSHCCLGQLSVDPFELCGRMNDDRYVPSIRRHCTKVQLNEWHCYKAISQLLSLIKHLPDGPFRQWVRWSQVIKMAEWPLVWQSHGQFSVRVIAVVTYCQLATIQRLSSLGTVQVVVTEWCGNVSITFFWTNDERKQIYLVYHLVPKANNNNKFPVSYSLRFQSRQMFLLTVREI